MSFSYLNLYARSSESLILPTPYLRAKLLDLSDSEVRGKEDKRNWREAGSNIRSYDYEPDALPLTYGCQMFERVKCGVQEANLRIKERFFCSTTVMQSFSATSKLLTSVTSEVIRGRSFKKSVLSHFKRLFKSAFH